MSAARTALVQSRTRGRVKATPADTFLALLMLALPVAGSAPLQAHIVDLPGAKLANLIAGAFALGCAFKAGAFFRSSSRLERNAVIAFFAYLSVFVAAFIRSVPNLGKFHEMDADTYPNNITEYALSTLLIPLIVASVFLYVVKFIRTGERITRLLDAIGRAMFVLSCVVLAAVALRPSVYADPNRFAMTKLTGDVLGMQYNGVATFYIITGPLLLYLALKRGAFWSLNYFLAFAAVVALESRAGLFAFVGMSAVTLIALGRARTLVAMVPLVALLSAIAAGPLLVQLLTMGFTEHSGINVTQLLSAREDFIWVPLLIEWWADPQRFWLGAGEYGILSSFVLYSGAIIAVGHAHNAYLDFFLDNGIVLVSLLMIGVIAFLVWARRVGRRLKSPLYWVLFLCVVGFLLSAMVGRRFYPDAQDSFLFPIIAIMINLARGKMLPTIEQKVTREQRHVAD